MRDPRVDPVPGDEICREFKAAIQGIILRKVHRAHGGFVFYRRDNGYQAKNEVVSLDRWRAWARLAEVVEIAPNAR